MDVNRFKLLHYLTALSLFFLFFFIAVSAAPRNFPSGKIISIRDGAGLLEVSRSLKEAGVVRNATWFRTVAIVMGGEKSLRSGDYHLPHTQNVYTLAWRIINGDHGIERYKMTIPEGFTVRKISTLFDERFLLFDNAEFESLAEEGYLFPDTYFIGVNATATGTIALLRSNFDKKIFPLTGEIERSGRTLHQVITMASILEGEAQSREDKKIVAGILWKRFDMKLPLQVDATFAYINGKSTKDLTLDDLKIDSPFNTYLYAGLPPTPISNPGLESIEATLNPIESPYLYFLTGEDGKMHYARTFDEHKINKQKHLQYLR